MLAIEWPSAPLPAGDSHAFPGSLGPASSAVAGWVVVCEARRETGSDRRLHDAPRFPL